MIVPLGQALERGRLDRPLEKAYRLVLHSHSCLHAGKVTVGITSHYLGACPALCRQVASLHALAVGQVKLFLFCAEK